jgi:hypothetical protein
MAKKRAREADGQSEAAAVSGDKMDEDGSSDDDVIFSSACSFHVRASH